MLLKKWFFPEQGLAAKLRLLLVPLPCWQQAVLVQNKEQREEVEEHPLALQFRG
jgi:hypothetical protein